MKIFSKCMSLLGSVLALLLCVTPAFAAAGTTADLDLSKTGSITLTLKDGDGNVKTGGFLDCIEVAQVADNGNGLTYILSNGFEDTDVSLQDFLAGKESAASLAERLSKVVPKDAKKVARRPDKNGTVTFPDCELGMYLICQRTKSGYYEAITPFVVTVPLNTEDGWVYDVTATPKVGTVTPTTPTKKKWGFRLPQTGQLNWPVPVLAVSGVALFTLGWVLMKDKHEKDSR